MASTNTEKPTGKAEKKKIATPIVEKPKKEMKVQNKAEVKEDKIIQKPEEKAEEKKEPKKEKKVLVKKVVKEKVEVNAKNVPVSTKKAVAMCKAIQGRTIPNAVEYMEKVAAMKLAVPMKGEIPHRKGNIMSGRYPIRATKHFISLLKSLEGNAIQHEVEEPMIHLAIANKGTTTMGRGGRTQKKRTNIKLVAKSRETKKENKK